MTLQPDERYNDVAELAAWVDELEYPSPYLKEFIQNMMSRAVVYGNKGEINFESDIPEPEYDAKIIQLPVNDFIPR